MAYGQIEELPLEIFPCIYDFEIAITKTNEFQYRSKYNYHLRFFTLAFFSPQRGFLAQFALWGHIAWDFLAEDFLPLNFWDREQGWDQIIYEKDEYIYVLEGDVDDPASGYHRWFRVRKERYLEEWQSALKICRRIISQEKTYS